MIKVNEKEVVNHRFPNRERDFVFPTQAVRSERNTITFKYEEDSDLLDLVFTKRELDRQTRGRAESILVIAYMPYSRLDRQENSKAFTLKYVAEIINALEFDGVVVMEAHSDVTCSLLNNSHSVGVTLQLFNESVRSGYVPFFPEDDAVCYPDATAQKRYAKGGNWNGLVGMKNRDFETGFINSLDIYCPEDYSVQGKNVVILDDLCSRGGTFMLTAEKLREMGAKSISLVVAHCEKTILLGGVLASDLIDKVVTTNSILSPKDVGSTVYTGKLYITNFEKYL